MSRATVKWIVAGTMSHSRDALRQGWIERHRERLSGNRALLSGHRRGPEWRIIIEEFCATHTLTSPHCLISIPHWLQHSPGPHAALFQFSVLPLFIPSLAPRHIFVYRFGAASLFLSCFKLRQVVFLLMFGRVQHSPYAEGGQLHFSQHLACLTLSFKRDGRDVRVLTSLHH